MPSETPKRSQAHTEIDSQQHSIYLGSRVAGLYIRASPVVCGAPWTEDTLAVRLARRAVQPTIQFDHLSTDEKAAVATRFHAHTQTFVHDSVRRF